jgi:glycine/D-amino acid oxidase-like deaminating enzyme
MRQTAENRILASSSFAGADPGPDPEGIAQALFRRVRGALVGGDRVALERYTVGYRPMPSDGFPIVGRARDLAGLYLAVTHSGITLAPAIGLFAAEELLDGRREDLLAPYRPTRFEG